MSPICICGGCFGYYKDGVIYCELCDKPLFDATWWDKFMYKLEYGKEPSKLESAVKRLLK